DSVNQSRPSGPGVIEYGRQFACGSGNSLTFASADVGAVPPAPASGSASTEATRAAIANDHRIGSTLTCFPGQSQARHSGDPSASIRRNGPNWPAFAT